MRLVLSRKGFDSTAGGGPSPLLPDGRLVSLPIPERRPTKATRTYEELGYGALLRSLGYDPTGPAHLDPDLDERRHPEPGWRGAFGQVGAAASHLSAKGVGSGDLFLFFGLFRRVEATGRGEYRFVRGERAFHAIWGYLEVDRRLDASGPVPAWAGTHPHFADPGRGRPNVVFLARAQRFGTFRFREALRLTRRGSPLVTDWRLPPCFDRVELSYHPRGVHEGRLRAASRGQEFVCQATPGLESWTRDLIAGSEPLR